jgi:ABC-type glycerol-3-phosphate transport system substrate-binding protein
MDRYVQGGVHTSPRRSVANDPKQHEAIGPKHWNIFYDALDKLPNTGPIPAPPQTKDMTNIFVKYIGLAMANEMTAKNAMEQMHKELEALLAKK